MAFLTSTWLGIGSLLLGGASYNATQNAQDKVEQQRIEDKTALEAQQAEWKVTNEAYMAEQSAFQEEQIAAMTQSRNEQKALNKAQQAREARNQIREGRVARGRILQSGVNSGVAGGSGVAGATGSVASQIGSNLGFNQGAIRSGENISLFQQQAADAGFAASNNFQAPVSTPGGRYLGGNQSSINNAQMFNFLGSNLQNIYNVGSSIFSSPTPPVPTHFSNFNDVG